MPKINVLVPIGCRSDEGLSAPIIRRLKTDPFFKVETPHLIPQDFGASYQLMDSWFHGRASDCDLILITGDRVEMCAAACAAFHNKVKIAHLYAGVVTNPITLFDDINRHVITLWSDIQFCESEDSLQKVSELKRPLKQRNNSWLVGITHLDDLEIDESKVPKDRPYDLILYNTPSKLEENEVYGRESELNQVSAVLLTSPYSILINGNPDGDWESYFVDKVNEVYADLLRAQFLGLLKNCDRFITNSSCAIYEAPYFLKPEQIILVGDRNINRPKVVCKPGGSDRIMRILKEMLVDEKTV